MNARRLRLVALAAGAQLMLTATPSWAADAWTDVSTLSDPASRWGQATASDTSRNEVVMFGGCMLTGVNPNVDMNPCPENLNGQSVNHTYTWSGSAWTLEAPLTSPSARIGAAMARDPNNGEIVLFGGISSAGSLLQDTWVWNGSNWTQKFPLNKPSSRAWHGMASLANGATNHVVLQGGCTGITSGLCSSFSNQTWTWSGTNWTQVCTSSCTPPSARMVGHQMTQQNGGNAFLFGGYFKSGGTNTYYQDTYTWNGSTWTALSPTTKPSKRSGGGIAKFQRSGTWGILLFGGSDDPTALTNETWFWNGTNWSQLTPTTPPSTRQSFGYAFSPADSRVMLFAGLDEEPASPGLDGTFEFSS